MGNICSKQIPNSTPYLAENHDIKSIMKITMSLNDYLSKFNNINIDILPNIKLTHTSNLRIILIKEFYDFFKKILPIFLTKENELLKLNISITDVIDDINKKKRSEKKKIKSK